ncbi:hypothetical protein HDU67_008822 [Dinochytrium kinnereticum]|nr:hypothetical protein HDU67_008822 [Dinochytrium kinnereticum]
MVLQSPLGSTISNATAIFSSCAGIDPTAITKPPQISSSKDSILTCVKSKLTDLSIPVSTIESLTTSCVDPALTSTGSARILGCLNVATAGAIPSTASDLVTSVMDRCVSPFLNGTADARGVAARCAEMVMEKTLGAGEVFALIRNALLGNLGEKGAQAFSDQCLWKTVGEFSATKGFDLTSCLFQGLAGKFCKDVLSAGPNSIAGGIGAYFTSFRDRVSQSALKLSNTFLIVVVVGVLMGTGWMTVLTLFGEGLIKFSIVASLVSLTVFMFCEMITNQ